MAFGTMNTVNFAKNMAPQQNAQQAPAASGGLAGTSPTGSATFPGQPMGSAPPQGMGGPVPGVQMPIIGTPGGSSYTRGMGMQAGGAAGYKPVNQDAQAGKFYTSPTGVVAGAQTPSAVPQMQQGPSAADIQAEMQRRNVGAQLGADPRNAALAGYMMAK